MRRAATGETITISLLGTPVVQLVPLPRERKPLDFDAWRGIAERAGPQSDDAESFVRRMRDSDRY